MTTTEFLTIARPIHVLPASRLLDRRTGWVFGATWQPASFAPVR